MLQAQQTLTEMPSVQNQRAVGSLPINDLAWIHNELIEWVYTNLMRKWDSIRKRGRGKVRTSMMQCLLRNLHSPCLSLRPFFAALRHV